MAGRKTAVKLPKEVKNLDLIQINDEIILKRVDLNTEFTARHNLFARKILGVATQIVIATQKDQESILSLLQQSFDVDILALLYLEQGKKFSEEQFERQKELILDSTIKLSDYGEVINDFFGGSGKSLMGDSLTFLTAMGKLRV